MLQQTDNAIAHAVEKEAKSKQELDGVKGQIKRQIDAKERERKKKIEAVASENRERIAEIDKAIQQFKDETTIRIKQINKQKNSELDQKGADTKRLDEIARQLTLIDEELKYIDGMRDKVAEYNKDKRELFDRKKEFKNNLSLEEENLNKITENFTVEDEKFGKQLQAQQTIINETEELLSTMENDLSKFEQFKLSETFQCLESEFVSGNRKAETKETAIAIIDNITALYYQQINRRDELKESIDKFLSHFSSQNLFNFSVNLLTTEDYYNMAQQLIEFIEESKIDEYEKRTNERFAYIITTIGKETSDLISRTGEIQKIVTKINKDFTEKNFVGAVKKIELRVNDSKNSIVVLLKMIKEFNDNAALDFGTTNLFSSSDKDRNDEKAIKLLKQLVKEISLAKTNHIHLADSFELTFRVEENQNDTGWVEKLSNVGSDGTDVLVKAMVNIMLLNVFKEGASKRFRDFRLHCMMDEIGRLHPNNVKGILKFANDRNIMLINGSPTESTPQSYRHIYMISKDKESYSRIRRIVSNIE